MANVKAFHCTLNLHSLSLHSRDYPNAFSGSKAIALWSNLIGASTSNPVEVQKSFSYTGYIHCKSIKAIVDLHHCKSKSSLSLPVWNGSFGKPMSSMNEPNQIWFKADFLRVRIDSVCKQGGGSHSQAIPSLLIGLHTKGWKSENGFRN